VVERKRELRQISAYTLDKFIAAVRKEAIIHDIDITQWALQVQRQENSDFKASHE